MKMKAGLVKVVTVVIFSVLVCNKLNAQLHEIPPDILQRELGIEMIDVPTVEQLDIEQKKQLLFGISPKLKEPYEKLAKADINAANELVESVLPTALELVDEDHRLKEKIAEVKKENAKVQQILERQNELIKEGELSTSRIITFEEFLIGFRKLTIISLAILIGLLIAFIYQWRRRWILTNHPDWKISKRIRVEKLKELGIILKYENSENDFMQRIGLAIGNIGDACEYLLEAKRKCKKGSNLEPVVTALAFINTSLLKLGIQGLDPEYSIYSRVNQTLKESRDALEQAKVEFERNRTNLQTKIEDEVLNRTHGLVEKAETLRCLSATLDSKDRELRRRERETETMLAKAQADITQAQLMLAEASRIEEEGRILAAQGRNLLQSFAEISTTPSGDDQP